jgi:hypothetical protein
MFIERLINFEIFIFLKKKKFLKTQYFPSQFFFCYLKIPQSFLKNSTFLKKHLYIHIISVEAANFPTSKEVVVVVVVVVVWYPFIWSTKDKCTLHAE